MPKACKVAGQPPHDAGPVAAWESPRLFFLTIKSSHRPANNALPVSSAAPTCHSPSHCLSQALSQPVTTCSPLFRVVSWACNPDHTSLQNSLVALLSFKDKMLPISSEPRKIPKFNSAKLRVYTNVGRITTLCIWN